MSERLNLENSTVNNELIEQGHNRGLNSQISNNRPKTSRSTFKSPNNQDINEENKSMKGSNSTPSNLSISNNPSRPNSRSIQDRTIFRERPNTKEIIGIDIDGGNASRNSVRLPSLNGAEKNLFGNPDNYQQPLESFKPSETLKQSELSEPPESSHTLSDYYRRKNKIKSCNDQDLDSDDCKFKKNQVNEVSINKNSFSHTIYENSLCLEKPDENLKYKDLNCDRSLIDSGNQRELKLNNTSNLSANQLEKVGGKDQIMRNTFDKGPEERKELKKDYPLELNELHQIPIKAKDFNFKGKLENNTKKRKHKDRNSQKKYTKETPPKLLKK